MTDETTPDSAEDAQEASAAPETILQSLSDSVVKDRSAASVPLSLLGHQPDLVDMARAKVMGAVSTYRALAGGSLDYAVGLSVVPNQQGQPMPVLILMLAIPALVIGEKIQSVQIMPNLWPEQQEIDSLVGQVCQSLLQARRQSAVEQIVPQNGHLPPAE